jgi:ribosomal protein L16 Arg81 hydroxylase
VADVDKILAEYERGASIVLESLYERWKPLAYFCRDIEKHLNHAVQTNIYLTPRSSQGFAPHYDTHDVFVLQIHGVKHWRIYDSPMRLPDRSLPHHTERGKLGPPLYELDINPGDLIYLPRGFVHEALTSDEESLHITVGIIAYTWFDVFTEVLAARRRQDYRFRGSLPAGFAEQPQITPAMRETFRQLAAALVEDADVDNALEKVAAHFVSSRQPLLDGALSSGNRVEAITPASAVKRRTNIICRITRDEETVTLSFYGKKIQLPAYTEPSLRFIVQATRFTVRDIPGDIDDAGKVVLVRSLLREGFLTLDE